MNKYVLLLCTALVFMSCAKNHEVEPEIEELNYSAIKQNVLSTSLNINENIDFSITDKGISAGLGYAIKFHKELDSLQWSIKNSNNNLNLVSEESFLFTWSQVFYLPGEYESYLIGYKDNKVVLSDTLTFVVKDEKDFLGYNWNELKKEESLRGLATNNFYNVFFNTAVEIQDNIATVELVSRDVNACKEDCLFQKTSLFDYMNGLYGAPKEGVDGLLAKQEYYTANFHKKLKQEDVLAIWETPKTVIALLKMNDSKGFEYMIRAEAKK